MSLCYDFQKWIIVSFGMVTISLIIGLVSLAYGQTADNPSDCGLLRTAYCTKENQTKWYQFTEDRSCASKVGESYARCVSDLMNKYGIILGK
jgi:hypothetical protein